MTKEEVIRKFKETNDFLEMAIEVLEQPEIIFCNECKYSFMAGGIMGCSYYTKIVAPHCFCSWARRRDE
jgi:hypothetical protein